MDRLREMVRLAESIGLVVLVDPDEFTLKTLVLPCRDQETGIRVDFIFSCFPGRIMKIKPWTATGVSNWMACR